MTDRAPSGASGPNAPSNSTTLIPSLKQTKVASSKSTEERNKERARRPSPHHGGDHYITKLIHWLTKLVQIIETDESYGGVLTPPTFNYLNGLLTIEGLDDLNNNS